MQPFTPSLADPEAGIASAAARAYTGVWDGAPSGVRGQSP